MDEIHIPEGRSASTTIEIEKANGAFHATQEGVRISGRGETPQEAVANYATAIDEVRRSERTS